MDMPPKATKKKPSSSASAKVSCCICCQPIQPDKDEALFCSGSCQQRLHRYCASVSADCYKSAKSDNTPFFCFCCYRVGKEEQLSFLESSIQAEISEMMKCTPRVSHQAAVSSNDQRTLSYAAAAGGESSDHYTHAVPTPQTGSTNPPHSPLSLNSTKKYNVIFFGVDECPAGTSRSVRLESDLSCVVSVISSFVTNIQSQALSDCYRLGKFSPLHSKPRPILVKFIRVADVSLVLSKKGRLKSPYTIKPDMTREERLKESMLLKERWTLIQSGIPRNS